MSAPPKWATERTDRPTYGGKVAEVAAVLGIELLPWQRLVVDVALEHDGNGRLAYRDVGVGVSRQAGKSTLMLPLLVWRLPASRCTAVYGAQSRLAARQKLLDDLWPVIAASKLSDRFSVARATGQEALRGPSGSICRVISSDETAAHGLTLNLALLDEAWALEPTVEQAVRPATVTRKNAQVWAVSTAGHARSVWWRSKVELGRQAVEEGRTSGVAYFEWSANPGDDLTDPAVLRSFHPAVDLTIDAATIAADVAAMTPAEAARAYGNVWVDDLDAAGWRFFDRDAWLGAEL
jgi:phage terminase large subunit-like protein